MSPFPFPTACTCHFLQGWRPGEFWSFPGTEGSRGEEPSLWRPRALSPPGQGLC